MKMITLKSSDNETFEIEEYAANGSQTIKRMIEDDRGNSVIPLASVDSKILAKVIEYLKKHVNANTVIETETADNNKKVEKEALEAFDKEFIKVDQATLFHLTLTANYLNIKGLLNLTYQPLADMIKGKTLEEICQTFNIKNDFSPEEEEEIRREIACAFG